MKTRFALIFLVIVIQESFTQEIKLRNLEKEFMGDTNFNGDHLIKGQPLKVSYTNYSYNEAQKTYKETLSTFLNLYRTGTFNFDSIGQIKNRQLLKYGNIKGADEYKYLQKNGNQTGIYIQRYWWYPDSNNAVQKRLDYNLKEIYTKHLLTHRFLYNSALEFIYDNSNNLTQIIRKEYKNPHEYNTHGAILNLKNNPTIKSEILYTYKYDRHNNRIEKREINTEHITYVTRYHYNEKGYLIKEIKLSYNDGILGYLNPKIYNYNNQGEVIELNVYIKHTAHDAPPSNEEAYIQSFLSFIDQNPDASYRNEHNAYTYEYDEKGNWITKTFFKKDRSYEYKYKLRRQIEYK